MMLKKAVTYFLACGFLILTRCQPKPANDRARRPDGDEDLMLSSLAFEVIPDNGEVDRWVKNGIPFVY